MKAPAKGCTPKGAAAPFNWPAHVGRDAASFQFGTGRAATVRRELLDCVDALMAGVARLLELRDMIQEEPPAAEPPSPSPWLGWQSPAPIAAPVVAPAPAPIVRKPAPAPAPHTRPFKTTAPVRAPAPAALKPEQETVNPNGVEPTVAPTPPGRYEVVQPARTFGRIGEYDEGGSAVSRAYAEKRWVGE